MKQQNLEAVEREREREREPLFTQHGVGMLKQESLQQNLRKKV